MTYPETIEYMYSRLPMFSNLGSSAMKSGFNNIYKLCELLGQPHQDGIFIHVAGTNGKGSVSHFLASVLMEAGYKTGLYTSPHLQDFRERIKIDGNMVSEDEIIRIIEFLKPAIEELKPSFFEITVAMAFHHFKKNKVDISVIETGLGGRLDSTNIIKPILSVITNIGYDHVNILGNTLPQIAAEKAGIIKPNTPVVISEKQNEVAEVFIETAKDKKAPLFFAGNHFMVETWKYVEHELQIALSEKNKTDHLVYSLDISGQYQTKNLPGVLESIRQLRNLGFEISETAIANGLKKVRKNTGLHGRWETIHLHPRIVLDVAHNESGIRELLKQLEVTTYHHLHIILGMVKDKDVDAALKLLPKNANYYFTNAAIPRALSGEALQLKAAQQQLKGKVFSNVNEAIKEVRNHANADDLILVCGSVFLVGEVNKK